MKFLKQFYLSKYFTVLRRVFHLINRTLKATFETFLFHTSAYWYVRPQTVRPKSYTHVFQYFRHSRAPFKHSQFNFLTPYTQSWNQTQVVLAQQTVVPRVKQIMVIFHEMTHYPNWWLRNVIRGQCLRPPFWGRPQSPEVWNRKTSFQVETGCIVDWNKQPTHPAIKPLLLRDEMNWVLKLPAHNLTA